MKAKRAKVLTPYICYALTELPPEIRERAKAFYVMVADLCKAVIGVRGFVPHEHYDPVKNANFTPQEVDEAERLQVCERTSVVIVAALAPSWGGGIEVEMANQSKVPVIILCEKDKLEQRLVSRLLRGNPAVRQVIAFEDEADALRQLRDTLCALFPDNITFEERKLGAVERAKKLGQAFDTLRQYRGAGR